MELQSPDDQDSRSSVTRPMGSSGPLTSLGGLESSITR